MLRYAKSAWQRLPVKYRNAIYATLRHTGLPYALSFYADYTDKFRSENFAAEILEINSQYPTSTPARRTLLEERMAAIMDSLILQNGVRKTTYAMRQSHAIDCFLSEDRFSPEQAPLRVLDVPSSTGISSLATLEYIRRRYAIGTYVLGDLAFQVNWDPETDCIFDDNWNLLQVRQGDRFSSINLGHTSGDVYTPMSRFWLLPVELRARRLLNEFGTARKEHCLPILLVHPEVKERIAEGIMELRQVDVFQSIPDKFDLILSFNLLQKNYFPESSIQLGIKNLSDALRDGGYLVLGDSENFAIYLRRGQHLEEIERSGFF